MAKSKAANKKRPNIIVRLSRETVNELRKVNWPTRQEATQLTKVVLVVIVIMAIFLGSLDALFKILFRFIVGLGS